MASPTSAFCLVRTFPTKIAYAIVWLLIAVAFSTVELLVRLTEIRPLRLLPRLSFGRGTGSTELATEGAPLQV